MNRPVLRAGVIGGAVAALLSLLQFVPDVGCVAVPLQALAFLGAGMLAAAWMVIPREIGAAAGQGAIAGLIAAAITGLVGMVLAPIGMAMVDGASIIGQLPPETLRAFEETGVDPSLIFGTGGALFVAGLCCGAGLIVGLGLGALGGVLYAALKPQQ
jgi:hypothetical protein